MACVGVRCGYQAERVVIGMARSVGPLRLLRSRLRSRLTSCVIPTDPQAANAHTVTACRPVVRSTGHPQVHETVHLLAETDRRATDSLAGFARWIGVTL